jgi:hypothetical protein
MPPRPTGKKTLRAEKKSSTVAAQYMEMLAKGNTKTMFLATVTAVKGDGRFTVKDEDKKEHAVRLSKTLFEKGAKHRNSTHKTAIRVGSKVIVNGGMIESVVTDSMAAKMKTRRANSKNNNNNNNIFNRTGGTRKARK